MLLWQLQVKCARRVGGKCALVLNSFNITSAVDKRCCVSILSSCYHVALRLCFSSMYI